MTNLHSLALRKLRGFALATLLLVACGTATTPTAVPSPTPTLSAGGVPTTATTKLVVIDTDMAADDWMAILYVLQRPDVTVEAITVTGTGEAHCGPGTQNALDLAALAGNADIPVSCGREDPLLGDHTFPANWRDMVDNLAGLSLPPNPNPPSSQSAVELLTSIIQDSPQRVVLVTLGPLTNVAEALQAEPSLLDKLEMIYIMGGAVFVPGNLQVPGVDIDNQVAEWNIYVDPHAAAVVMESGAPVTLVSLDATNHAPLTRDFYRRLGADRVTPESDFVYQVLSQMQDFINSGGYYFWDPLAAAVAIDESLATCQPHALKVIEDEGPESGRTVAAEDGGTVQVCTAANGAAFEEVFLNTLNGRGSR
jgi:inosine-uridine nucleoside N-ribohydrolase